MAVNGISSQSFCANIVGQKLNKKDNENEFYKSLSDTMGEKIEVEYEESKYITKKNSNLSTKAVHTIEIKGENAVAECLVRNISYAESDNVKVSIADGCVYKARVNSDNNTVYVEQKSEDGTVKGYEVEISKVKEDTDNPIEQMAFATWNKESKSEKLTNYIGSNWDEALLQFYNFVEDRVKNGAPKYQIGGAELAIDEWKNLLKKIDGSLDAVKDQLAERNEEMEKLQDDNKIDESSEKLILELLRDRKGNDNISFVKQISNNK